MRDNIKAMMDREVAQRRSAQARLADALESSQEGVVVVDANDGIVLANAQAADFLGVSPSLLKPGTPLARLAAGACRRSADAGRVLMRARTAICSATSEVSMAGRPLAAHQPQPDPRRRLHRAVQRHQPLEDAGIVAARDQPAARRRARKHVAGPVPVTTRRTGSRSSTGAIWKSSSCRADRIKPGITLPEDPGDQRRQQQSCRTRPSISCWRSSAQMLGENGIGTASVRAQRRPRGVMPVQPDVRRPLGRDL